MPQTKVKQIAKKTKGAVKKKSRLFYTSTRLLSKNFLKTILFLLTRPLARVIIYTGSLHSFMFRKLRKAKANKKFLINLGGKNIFLKTSDNRKIDAMFFNNTQIYPDKQYFTEETRPTVLFCLGNSSLYENCKDMICFYLTKGVNVMVFNYGGYGQSEGSPSVFSTYKDIEAAYDYIKKQHRTADRNIIVHGFSIGGGPATYLASKYPVNLVLDRTYSSLGNIAGGFIGKIINYLYPYDNIKKISSVKGEIHIVEAVKDEVMAHHHTKSLFNEIIRSRHPDAHGEEIEALKSTYITIIPSTHTDCWLSNHLDVYSHERNSFSKKVIPSFKQPSPKTNFISKLWKKLNFFSN